MGGKHRNTEVHAMVVDSARQGETPRSIARKSKVPLRTIQDWLKAARDLANAEDRDPRLVDREYRLTFMGQELQEIQLQALADKAEAEGSAALLPYIVPLNILKGTSFDKTVKGRESGAQVMNVQFNFYSDE